MLMMQDGVEVNEDEFMESQAKLIQDKDIKRKILRLKQHQQT